ncbi:MAG: PfkB family carbohydrate kinase [Pseudomonadota bacterium]
MARILIVGNATLDIINVVDRYPQEDQEVRALAQHTSRGGNAANTAVVLSQLGHHCNWAGSLADEPGGVMIREDLAQKGIDLSAVHTVNQGKVPTSYITLSQQNGSRTIVHYRDLPEYPAEKFTTIALDRFDWLHVEGRNLSELKKMLQHAKAVAPHLPISLEAEKPREGIEALFSLAEVVMFSQDFAMHHGAHSAAAFLQQMQPHHAKALLTCTWGEDGAYALPPGEKLQHVPAFSPERVVDTLGAGDVFNAGLIDQLVRGNKPNQALVEAARLAGRKCGMHGLDNIF